MRHWMIVGILALVGCSSSDDAAEPIGPCQQRHGSYIVKYTARSGNCGDAAETVLNVDRQPTAVEAPCTGSIEYTPDNCEVTYSSTCPADSVMPGAELTVTGKSEWRHDAEAGTATEAWTVKDANGQVACQGTYDVLITKQ